MYAGRLPALLSGLPELFARFHSPAPQSCDTKSPPALGLAVHRPLGLALV